METMISVERAKALLEAHVSPSNPILLPLYEVNGLVLATDIVAPINIPSFPQSNMDGYAFAYDEHQSSYPLSGEIAAGDKENAILAAHHAVRIFTGAAVPIGADTVAMQEKVSVAEGKLNLLDPTIKKGDHVRPVGAEIRFGEIALKKGTLLNPAAIGFIASLGIDQVFVYPAPRVGILVTGNELQKPGNSLHHGEVYESNSFTLVAALQSLGIRDVKILQAEDQLDQISFSLQQLLEEFDFILMTGGVSVGDYDFTLPAFEACGVNAIFHKIKQKPGKPLLFGTKGHKIVFGLPGNPASVLTCFYEYVLPAIGYFSERNRCLKSLWVPLSHEYKKSVGLTHFLKAIYNGETVSLQSGQESFKLSSYAMANCLVVLPEASEAFHVGDLVEIHLLED